MTAAERSDTAILARGAVINILGNVGRLSRAFSLYLIASLFGADILGYYLLSWAVVDFLGKISAAGQEMTAVRFISPALADEDNAGATRLAGSAIVIVAAVTVAIGGALWLSAQAVAALFSEPVLVVPIRIMALAIPAHGARNLFLAFTRAKKIMQYEMLTRSFIEPFGLLFGTVVAWVLDGGLVGVALAQAFSLVCSGGAAMLFYFRTYRTTGLFSAILSPSEASRLARYGLPIMGRDVMSMGITRADLFLVGYFLDATAYAIYGMVQQFLSFMRFSRQGIEPILAPLISEQHHRGDSERLGSTYVRATRWALTVNLIFLGLSIFAGAAVLSIFNTDTTDFTAGAAALALLFTGQLAYGALGLSESILMMTGRPGLTLINNGLMVIVTSCVGYVLIPLLGVTGAALGTMTAMVLVIGIQVVQAYRATGAHPFGKSLAKPAVAFGGAALLVWLIPGVCDSVFFDGIVHGVLFLIWYLVFLVALGLEEDERRFVKRQLGRFRTKTPQTAD